ncbi:MAG: proline--tRNA ligase, partial [Elusimicrobiales bacterium]
AYSFHTDEKDCIEWYWKLYDAYSRIFKRCGLNFKAVEAVTGAIGGNYSHEFMVLASTGEAEIAFCSCGYAANTERAEVKEPVFEKKESELPLEDIPTPDLYTVEDVSRLTGLPKEKFIKTMFYKADNKIILVLIRGDHEINEDKIIRLTAVSSIERLSPQEYSAIIGGKVGFAGPVGIRDIAKKNGKNIDLIIADNHLKGVANGISGANRDDYHTKNINFPRDWQPDIWADVKVASKGDRCVKCGSELKFTRGIEVGQIFKLGTKYSSKLDCYYLDKDQQKKLIEMGCYGIGVSRIVAAAIEQHHDEKGIIWPVSIAPFHIYLINIENNEDVLKTAHSIYSQLANEGIEVLWDDRDERAGVKFNDCDLIGLPWRIVVSKKTVSCGEFELKKRISDLPSRMKVSDLKNLIEEIKSQIL